jgi:hypothetical protein
MCDGLFAGVVVSIVLPLVDKTVSKNVWSLIGREARRDLKCGIYTADARAL